MNNCKCIYIDCNDYYSKNKTHRENINIIFHNILNDNIK